MDQTSSNINCDGIKTTDRDFNCFSKHTEKLSRWLPVSKTEFDPTKHSKLRSEYFINTDNQKPKKCFYGYVCKQENAIPVFPSSFQPPLKIIKLEQQGTADTSDTSFIKEKSENELSDEVNLLLFTKKIVEQIEVTPAKEKTVDEKCADIQKSMSEMAEYRRKILHQKKLKTLTERKSLKKEKHRGHLDAEIQKKLDSIRMKFIHKNFPSEFNMDSKKF